jgi:Uma2 family endonuclease
VRRDLTETNLIALPDPTQTALLTVDEFEALLRLPEYDDRSLELIDDVIAERFTTMEQCIIVGLIGFALQMWLNAQAVQPGWVTLKAGYSLPADRYNMRIPDVSYFRRGAGRKLRAKAAYYLEHGTQTVWLVYPRKKIVEVYRVNGAMDIVTENEMLDGGDVLPGFSMSVAPLFNLTE